MGSRVKLRKADDFNVIQNLNSHKNDSTYENFRHLIIEKMLNNIKVKTDSHNRLTEPRKFDLLNIVLLWFVKFYSLILNALSSCRFVAS